MPPKATSNTLSDREVELLRNMTRCLKSKPDVGTVLSVNTDHC